MNISNLRQMETFLRVARKFELLAFGSARDETTEGAEELAVDPLKVTVKVA